MFEDIKKNLADLEKAINDPFLVQDKKKLASVAREHAAAKEIFRLVCEWEKLDADRQKNEKLLIEEKDPEIISMARAEQTGLEAKLQKLAADIDELAHPADPRDSKNVIMEIRAGTGGDESALFATDLFRLYARYAERRGWKTEIYSASRIGLGGFKEVVFAVSGRQVFGHLKYEAGAHRVQRVPVTEKAGRIHTSAATVAVLPEAEEIDMEIKNEDLRIDTYAASGPGGQKVNTTNSAVRITHLPTNLVVQCQDQKSQHQNKEKAMLILRARLADRLAEEKQQKEAAERKKQVGTGDRSEKIRTYNFPQDRLTDHRLKQSWHGLDRILDGDLDDLINSLKAADKKGLL